MEDLDGQFFLNDDETYEKICGEILLTTEKRVVIHCTICEAKYQGFEAYINHVFLNHEIIDSASELDDKPEVTEISASEISDDFIINSDEHLTIKLEIEPVESDVLNEIELPISILKDEPKIVQNDVEKVRKKERSSQSAVKKAKPQKTQIKKPQVQKDISNDEEFVIPSVIRPVLKRNSSIRKPIPEEERKYKCPICGLGFKEKHNMRYHFRRHSNEKNEACPDCGKKFYTLSEVRVHRQFHTQKREFLCSDCGRAFRTKFQLNNHIKRHKNQRDFKCSTCEKAFFDNETLQAHIRSHTLERPFFCKTCNATFARITALQNHVKLHENKRQYKCNLCDSAFNQAAGLFSHMRITHKAA